MSAVIDEDVGVDWKAEWLSWMARRDQLVLEQLREQGFCLAMISVLNPPVEVRRDFTFYMSSLAGFDNLVVSAPAWTKEELSELFDKLPQRRFDHGKTVLVTDAFAPAPANWFQFDTEIVYVDDAVFQPPYLAGPELPWAHCATLKITDAGKESDVRVIHVGGIGSRRDSVYVNFLAHHRLVPRRILV